MSDRDAAGELASLLLQRFEAGAPPLSLVRDGEPMTTGTGGWVEPTWEALEPDGARVPGRLHMAGPDGLELRCEVARFTDLGALEWTAWLHNGGCCDSALLSEVQGLDLTLPVEGGDPVVLYARGGLCTLDDYAPLAQVMTPGAHLHFQPGGGRSSSEFMPFANIRLSGHLGIMLGVGWSGEWAVDITRTEAGLRVRVGQASTHLRLHPRESIRTPLVLLMPYAGDAQKGQNLLRRFILAHHRPTMDGKPLELQVFCSSWGGTPTSSHLANIAAIAEHDLPIEWYWIDAEWFGADPWFLHTGDWRPRADIHPQGLRPIGDALHAVGRKFLLWVEPERVCEGTPWYEGCAQWLLQVPREERHYNWGNSQCEPQWRVWESLRNQIRDNDRLWDLGNPEGREFLTAQMIALIEDFGLDCFRHDANIAQLEFWRAADEPERQGICENRWVQGLYAFWDALLARFPGLLIDNCASGGRRIDLESISRTVPLWRTDHPEEIIGRQCHTWGIANWVPLNSTGAVNPARDDDYTFRSAYSASLAFDLFTGITTVQTDPPPADFPYERARRALEQYLAVQPYFSADYYPLSCYSQAPDAWMAWQFHRPEDDSGLVQAFRREQSPSGAATYPLRGLEAGALYELTDLDSGETRQLAGEALMTAGLRLEAAQRPAALLVVYTKV
jgi:alpha-galactosidase